MHRELELEKELIDSAHLSSESRSASGANGVSVGSSKAANPLAGLVPRKVTVEQAKKIMEADVNPFKGMAPFSASYKKILEGRKKLPVYDKMHEFLHIFEENQITVMEGQTGSGKTTQIPQFVCYADLPHLRGKMVACTQPRRVAAMSVAQRVADEMDGEFGVCGAANMSSAAWKAGRILYPFRRHDGARDHVPQVHD